MGLSFPLFSLQLSYKTLPSGELPGLFSRILAQKTLLDRVLTARTSFPPGVHARGFMRKRQCRGFMKGPANRALDLLQIDKKFLRSRITCPCAVDKVARDHFPLDNFQKNLAATAHTGNRAHFRRKNAV